MTQDEVKQNNATPLTLQETDETGKEINGVISCIDVADQDRDFMPTYVRMLKADDTGRWYEGRYELTQVIINDPNAPGE